MFRRFFGSAEREGSGNLNTKRIRAGKKEPKAFLPTKSKGKGTANPSPLSGMEGYNLEAYTMIFQKGYTKSPLAHLS